MRKAGQNSREIYNEFYSKQFSNPMTFPSFQRSLRRWMSKVYPDDNTLMSGTYEGFTAHAATVQVSAGGQITQAWIKQRANPIDPEEFLEAIRGRVEPYTRISKAFDDGRDMLEIPLFDMHWGVAFFDWYEPVLSDILSIIEIQHWNKIVIPFGQDFFHNDSIVNGQTTKGTNIEKVDMPRAVKDAKRFLYALIDAAIENSDIVKVMYSSGNHDRSISWMFMQTLLERYGEEVVDDSLEFRKIITYGNNAVMVTHGDSKRATAKNLAHVFPISFPEEFGKASVREVHSGHLHNESDTDVFGIMVRRLSTGNKTDEWSDKEDFIGAHRRFMLFHWSPEKLKAIYYV